MGCAEFFLFIVMLLFMAINAGYSQDRMDQLQRQLDKLKRQLGGEDKS